MVIIYSYIGTESNLSSRCEYLIHVKGQEFVRQIQARFPHLLEQVIYRHCSYVGPAESDYNTDVSELCNDVIKW